MYSPPAFRWDDRTAALELAARYNFAELITVVGGAPLVSHLPFLIDVNRGVLRGHLARANPHSGHVDGVDHLVVFTGPHAYISPDWYADRNDVPTWNYLAVHAAGGGRILTEDSKVDAFLADLTQYEEARRADLNRGGRMWTLADIASKDHARMRAGIVAFEIDIASVSAKAKLNQNKSPESVARVIGALGTSGSPLDAEVADAMKDNYKQS